MSPTSAYFTLSLHFLIQLVPIQCYTYQTQPLFLSFAELSALESNSFPQTDEPRLVDRVGDHNIKTFVVKCHADGVEVVMKAYLLDPGLPVEPTHLRLGPSRAARDHCTAKASGNGEYVIRAALTDCGSEVKFTQSALLYTNLLLYSPPEDLTPAREAAVPVQCEYKRRYTVSSRALKPTWSPPRSIQSTHLDLDFQLRLMTSDWRSERESSVYFLGEAVNMQASVDHHHLPLRLYADSCVATLTPDVTSYPRYPFIDHQGCFIDSQLDGSSSRFLPRVQDEVLRIQLEPFVFHQDHRHTMFITCRLEAEPVSDKHPVKKACSYIGGRWRSVDGNHSVCESCSRTRSHHRRALRSEAQRRQSELQRETVLGPIIFLP